MSVIGSGASDSATKPLVRVQDLTIAFRADQPVVTGVSFELHPGRTLALVGESGSGKTTTGRALLGLSPVVGGSIKVRGVDVTHLNRRRRRDLWHEAQMIYQNPFDSLTPHMKIIDLVAEPLRLGKGRLRRTEARLSAGELLKKVGLDEGFWNRRPRELSGGQLQRVAIARALALDPVILVADEPVAKLDVSIQAQVVDLITRLQGEMGIACLFITHNLALVPSVADDIAIMTQGVIVEAGTVESVLSHPQHPYTQELLSAVPRLRFHGDTAGASRGDNAASPHR